MSGRYELVSAECPICRRPDCIYEQIPDIDDGLSYFINEIEVTKSEFVAEERRCGFNNTLSHQERPATSGFGGADGTKGRVDRV